MKSGSVISACNRNSFFTVLPIQESIDSCEIIFLALPFKLNQEVLSGLDFKGKTLIDCTNPVGPGITHGLQSKISGADKVQEWALNAKVDKSYTIYGFENLQNTMYDKYNVKPAMLIAGNDIESKQSVTALNFDLGFETVDVGLLSQALHLEHMTLLWVSMVRANNHHPNFTWAYLER